MIKNLRHVGLVVSDMDRAIKFYQGLGCKVISRHHETWANRPIEVCKMTNNVELIKGDWTNHVAFTVSDWPEIKFIWPHKPGVKYADDSEGNVIELVKEEK